MNNIKFDFDHEKAIEVFLYLASKREKLTKKTATIRDIFKLMYLADKESLQEFGRFLCNNNYVAMKQGPVPSEAYDIVKEVRDFSYSEHGFTILDNHYISVNRDANLDYLSESDVMCMDNALMQYGLFSSDKLKNLSHDSVWKEAWDSSDNRSVPIDVRSIIETLADNEDLLSYVIEGNCD